MHFFVSDKHPLFSFALKFEQPDLAHTHIEVSFDGFAYRFPRLYIRDWLEENEIEWHWVCRKRELWVSEPGSLHQTLIIDPPAKPPIIKFKNSGDAILFKLTWAIE